MADYNGVYPWIADCLQERGFDDPTQYDRHIGSVLREMLSPYPAIAFDTLTGDDRSRVEEAAGYRTAARLHASLTTGGAAMSLRSEDDGEFKAAYDGDITAQWLALANQALRGTSFGSSVPTLATGGVNGPSRRRCADRCYESGYRRWPY